MRPSTPPDRAHCGARLHRPGSWLDSPPVLLRSLQPARSSPRIANFLQIGRRTSKVAPAPRSLLAETEPPIASTTLREMYRPSPRPP